ncbi:somatostatin receptor type 5-like protein [Dinothrombium tinctorium]|uniref:Somatostatin receptor type 5-like protein n=1 Tax=Dinothrombium tinctorium TaxID=1965070 RepID=A0A3S3PTQ8_9ACAR|nr:somatostatin receptor type 5-like protein [Dinothrombium tinctorium]RWS16194.1 somatostatin receptor type 5-like protein [Dinothrombium tinctorium]RWS17245.1 somatostatin receptor type 5-like protein [Dinothrombium tinctorium]
MLQVWLNPISLIIASIGFVNNVLVIYTVFTSKVVKKVTKVYLLNLAIADILFLSRVLLLVAENFNKSWYCGLITCKLIQTLTLSACTACNFLVAIISIDRYIAICFPFIRNPLHTQKNAKISWICIWIVSISFQIPSAIYAKTFDQMNPAKNETITICRIDWPPHIRKLTFALNMFIGFFIPSALIAVFYTRIVLELLRFNCLAYANDLCRRSRSKAVMLSLTIVSCYFACWTPYWTVNCFLAFTMHESNKWTHLKSVYKICLIVAFTHSALNPILYVFLGDKFQKYYKKALKKRKSTLSALIAREES